MIKNRLSYLMQHNDISQTKLANMVGIHQSLVSFVCNGKRIFDIPILMKVCKVLSCEPTDIYDENVLNVIYPELRRN